MHQFFGEIPSAIKWVLVIPENISRDLHTVTKMSTNRLIGKLTVLT